MNSSSIPSQPPTIQDILTRAKNDKMVDGQIRYLDTVSAYDLWSEVYDTDGNFLQALDTLEVPSLLDAAISYITAQSPTSLRAVDLGCGTGRNTLQLLEKGSKGIKVPWEITAVDLSAKMLEIAKSRCQEKATELSQEIKDDSMLPTISFDVFDMIAADSSPSPGSALPIESSSADLIVSTLVLEHIPLPTYMRTISRLLKPGGTLVLTNMHNEMGGISQAGFVDPKTGDKIRPVSYAHSAEETVKAASDNGLVCLGYPLADNTMDFNQVEKARKMKEIAIDEELAEKLGVRAKKWVGIHVWYGAIFKKLG